MSHDNLMMCIAVCSVIGGFLEIYISLFTSENHRQASPIVISVLMYSRSFKSSKVSLYSTSSHVEFGNLERLLSLSMLGIGIGFSENIRGRLENISFILCVILKGPQSDSVNGKYDEMLLRTQTLSSEHHKLNWFDIICRD